MGRFDGVEVEDLELVGERLTLRRWRPEDASDVERAMQDPGLHPWLPVPSPYTAAHAWGFVTSIGQEERSAGTGLGCAVVETDSGRLVGSAELRNAMPGRRWADIGYWIAADARGKAYAAEATRLLAEWGFAHGVHRIEVRTDVRNVASARAALAAGFRYDGSRRGVLGVPDERYDLAAFGRLSTDPGDPIPPAYPRLQDGVLIDEVVAVRCSIAADADGWHEQEADDLSVATGFTGLAPDAAEIRRTTASAGLDWVVGAALTMTIVDLGSSRFAGSVRVELSGPPQIGEVRFRVHPAFRGRGYPARALRLLVPWAFDVAGLARLELGAKRENIAAQQAARSGGFAAEGVLATRLRNGDGSFSDEMRFALVNPRYR